MGKLNSITTAGLITTIKKARSFHRFHLILDEKEEGLPRSVKLVP
jgi:hypothetical protein